MRLPGASTRGVDGSAPPWAPSKAARSHESGAGDRLLGLWPSVGLGPEGDLTFRSVESGVGLREDTIVLFFSDNGGAA